MKNREKRRDLAGLILHGIIFIATAVCTYNGVTAGAGKGQAGDGMVGLGFFKAFTVDSNVLAAMVSGILIVCLILKLCGKRQTLPRWAVTLQYISVCGVGLTFAVVLFFLAPMWAVTGLGFWSMYAGDLFFLHFLNPLLAAAAFIFTEPAEDFALRENFLGLLPTAAYSVWYLINVVILKVWADFYNFTLGGKTFMIPVALLAMYGATFLIGRLLLRGRKAVRK